METRCEPIRERLAEQAGAPRPWAAELEGHLAGCEGCRAWAAGPLRAIALVRGLPRLAAPDLLEARVRAELSARGAEGRVASGLERLRRLSAPAELDGRVVAALHAGHREDRAADSLRSLPRLAAPAELDAAVAADLARLAAAGRLSPGSAADEVPPPGRRVRRSLRALIRDRKPAPTELRARVDADLVRTGPGRRSRRAAAIAAATLAAFLLGWAGGATSFFGAEADPELAGGAPPDLELDFEVRYLAELSAHTSPMGQRLLTGLSGGLAQVVPPVGEQGSPGSRRTPLRAPAEERPVASDPSASGGGDEAALEVSHPLLALVPDAPLSLRYAGQRLVRLADPLGSGHALVLRERVASDGAGRFAIDPLEVVSAPDQSIARSSFFHAMQKSREGFFFRYRDFRIRDLERFHAGWRASVADEPIEVAGRRCILLDVRRASQAERYYEVALDVATGLVMRYRELVAATGELLMEVGFETFALGPQADQVVLTAGDTAWEEFDPNAGAPASVTFELRAPSFVPSGYGFERAATRLDSMQRRWVEFVYCDGVEEIFFLHGAPEPDPQLGTLPFGGRVQVASFGAWTLVEGEVRGTPVVAAGRVDAEDLLLLVQSALD